jgi:hypothetical protein
MTGGYCSIPEFTGTARAPVEALKGLCAAGLAGVLAAGLPGMLD